MIANSAGTTNPFQWMINAGVDVIDVEWLKSMRSPQELHMPGHRERAEQIYEFALHRILASESPIKQLIKQLN